MTITRDFESFYHFTFETGFLENRNPFHKLECRYLAECTTIENAIFPYKTVLPETNVKRNRMGSTKWIYHKERSFASFVSF